jgi:hypothetical protein
VAGFRSGVHFFQIPGLRHVVERSLAFLATPSGTPASATA